MRWSRNATSSALTFFTRATHSRSIVSFEIRGMGFPAMRGSATGMVFSLMAVEGAAANYNSKIPTARTYCIGGVREHGFSGEKKYYFANQRCSESLSVGQASRARQPFRKMPSLIWFLPAAPPITARPLHENDLLGIGTI